MAEKEGATTEVVVDGLDPDEEDALPSSSRLAWIKARRLRVVPSAWILTLGILVSGFIYAPGAAMAVPAAPGMAAMGAQGTAASAAPGMAAMGTSGSMEVGTATPEAVTRLVLPLTLVIAFLLLLLPWERFSARAQAISAMVGVAMMIPLQLGALPWSPHHAVVVLMPILFLALRSPGRYLAAGLVLSTIALWIPVGMGMHDFMDVIGHGVIYCGLIIGVGVTVHALIKRLRGQQQYIIKMARIDFLTGAWNRRGWREELIRAFSRATRDGSPLTIVLADFDLFKSFNDRHGHQAGDALLKRTVTEWSSSIRDTDFLSRWGGDEFGFILPTCSSERAVEVIERLSRAVPYGQRASFGFATWDRVESADEVIRRADAALYEEKSRRTREIVELAATRSAAG